MNNGGNKKNKITIPLQLKKETQTQNEIKEMFLDDKSIFIVANNNNNNNTKQPIRTFDFIRKRILDSINQ